MYIHIYIYVYTRVYGGNGTSSANGVHGKSDGKGSEHEKPTRATLGLDNLADDLHCSVLAPELQKFLNV